MSETTAVRVDPSNERMLKAWDGDDGALWAKRAQRFNDGVAAYREIFFSAAAIEPSDKVLDVGCGAGETTRDAARQATEGSARGVDLSTGMLGLARRLAEQERVPNVSFEQADAQVHPFPEAGFDVVISRHGSMFFGTPLAAFTNLARVTRPGGRLVLLTWQPFRLNEWITTFRTIFAAGREVPSADLALSDPAATEELLTSAGYTGVRSTAVHRPMYFGQDVDDAAEFIVEQHGGRLRDLDEAARAKAVETLRADLAEHQTDRGVYYDSAAWLVEARRP
ncbi:class I SAM-dependent methyltransferase [Amycolatopsis regifaucium]|uniref:Methyltransferase n=1 Tax=Amycolatopsis regifaucium TaxID=546365 RepID=A0A154MSW2_9PSEU|nr:class I SAM-dependent methyltransferase [Amycolatopsis regifaucium]KZB86579.1 methyltransferase [Amycolatopsis regifaucium]OKA03524.1 SAM-dependent methyltransferase [Amycolatopsis regifaucium]SFJ16680.1 Ubiquinone/menaquinone biosynthesis C-methylase UbiE [Amycolatopsis regifaucium]